MPDNGESAVKLPPVEQVGIVVQDVDRAAEQLTALFGWGPFRIREVAMQGFTPMSAGNQPGHLTEIS